MQTILLAKWKIGSLILCSVLLLQGSIALAQQGQQLSNTRVTICNESEEKKGAKIIKFKDLELTKDLCIQVANNNEEQIQMDLDMVDGAINDYGNISCYNKSYKGAIQQFVNKTSFQYTIGANQTEQFQIPISRNLATIGQFFGCAHYYLKSAGGAGMFQANIGSTKKFIIDIEGQLVSKVKLIDPTTAKENQLHIEKKINQLKAMFKIINEGNVGQKGSYSGTVNRLIGEPESFQGSFFIQGGEELDISEVIDMPWYAIFGTLDIKIAFDPQTTLGYTEEGHSAPQLQENEYTFSENIINYILIVIILSVITIELVYIQYKRSRRGRHISGSATKKKKDSGPDDDPKGIWSSIKKRREWKMDVIDGKDEAQSAHDSEEKPSEEDEKHNSQNQQNQFEERPGKDQRQPYHPYNIPPHPYPGPQYGQPVYYQNTNTNQQVQTNYHQTPPPAPQSMIGKGTQQAYTGTPNNYQTPYPGYPNSNYQQPTIYPPQPVQYTHPSTQNNDQYHRGIQAQPGAEQRNYRMPPSPYPPHQGNRTQFYAGPDGYY